MTPRRNGWRPSAKPANPPVLGYFARMCKEKGLHLVVDAYISLKKRNRVPQLKLHIGGAMVGDSRTWGIVPAARRSAAIMIAWKIGPAPVTPLELTSGVRSKLPTHTPTVTA